MLLQKKIKFIFLFLFFIKLFLIKKKIDAASEKPTDKIPVFTFHRLVPDEVKKDKYKKFQWTGSINIFEEMIRYMYDHNYKSISTEEFYKWYIREVEYDKKTVLITIDDGFYEDYYLVFPILKKYNFKATSFVVGNRIKDITIPYDKYTVSYLGIDAINKVRKVYPFFEFQSHSFNMHYFIHYNKSKKTVKLKTMSYEELKNDTLKNEKYGFNTMAYPYGKYNEEIKEILKEHGYLVAFKFGGTQEYATRKSDRFAIPRIKINGYATLNILKKWLKF